jgi:hypothetical protein
MDVAQAPPSTPGYTAYPVRGWAQPLSNVVITSYQWEMLND